MTKDQATLRISMKWSRNLLVTDLTPRSVLVSSLFSASMCWGREMAGNGIIHTVRFPVCSIRETSRLISPVRWEGKGELQCDPQSGSFLAVFPGCHRDPIS